MILQMKNWFFREGLTRHIRSTHNKKCLLKTVYLLVSSIFTLLEIYTSDAESINDQSLSSKKSAFIVEVPFYCPPPKIESISELIKKEPERFSKKIGKNDKKRIAHEKYIKGLTPKNFTRGQEPYRIAEDDFRGFLKVYSNKPGETPIIPSKLDNPRSHEHAKPIKKATHQILKTALENETAQINEYVNLFRSEAFGQSGEESKSHFEQSMRMILLLNRYKSISSAVNKSLKRFNKNLDQGKNVLMLRGFWEPKWEKKINGKWTQVPLKEVRHFFLEYLKKDKENALEFIIENEGGEIDGEQKGNLKGIFSQKSKRKNKITLNTHVPYQELREAIRIHPLKIAMTEELKGKNHNISLYEAIHDSDLTGLRIITDGSTSTIKTGLYSHYERLIQKHNKPDLLTTGYRAARDGRFKDTNYFMGIYSAIEEDRYVRASLSKVDSRLTYYSEPNFLVKIPSNKLHMPYSFLDNLSQWNLDKNSYSFKKYSPHESLNILKEIYKSKGHPHIVFDPTHPVLMKLPERMLVNKHTGTPFKVGNYNKKKSKIIVPMDEYSYSFLKISENVSQSPLSFRDYSIVVYSQFGLSGKKYSIMLDEEEHFIRYPNNIFNSILCTLFNSYDPLWLIENLHELQEVFQIKKEDLRTMGSRIRFVCKNFEALTQAALLNFKNVEDKNINKNIQYVNKLSKKTVQLEKLKNIFNPIFQREGLQAPMTTLIEAARAMGIARNEHIRSYYD